MPVNLKMTNVWFLCSNFNFPLPNVVKFLYNGFDHNIQVKYDFGYNVLYGSRVMPFIDCKGTIYVVLMLFCFYWPAQRYCLMHDTYPLILILFNINIVYLFILHRRRWLLWRFVPWSNRSVRLG